MSLHVTLHGAMLERPGQEALRWKLQEYLTGNLYCSHRVRAS